jgi:hypothetical protein
MVRAERGAKPDELRQILDEGEILSGEIDELWHDGWRGYRHSSMIMRRTFHTRKNL